MQCKSPFNLTNFFDNLRFLFGHPVLSFKAPAATWIKNDIRELEVSLSDYRGKFVVLLFYPQDFTFICPTEVIAFGTRSGEFESANCSVLAISTDSVASHHVWMKSPRIHGGVGQIEMPLVSDMTHAISKSYNVLKEDMGVALRSIFIIDPQGIIRHMSMNDFPVGRDVDEVLRLVKGFDFADRNGEVCPANWKPGKKTFKPTYDNTADYLRKLKN